MLLLNFGRAPKLRRSATSSSMCARPLRCSFRLISFAQPMAASKRKYLSHFPRLVCPPLARSLASSFKFKMLTRAQHEQHGPPVHKNRSFRAKTTSATAAAGVRRLRARCNHYPSLKSSSWIPLHTVLFITVVTKRRPSTDCILGNTVHVAFQVLFSIPRNHFS